ILKTEENELGRRRKKVIALQEEKAMLEGKVEQCNGEFRQRAMNAVTPQEIKVAKGYIATLQENIREIDRQILNAQDRVEQQIQVVVEATKEVSSLEKLEEGQLDEYNKMTMKQEELFIEEFVSNSNFYAV
ncbi:MAG: FliJ family protein, partial [Clostridiales bacterium]|nr:FliJ family protein [Clostridiales bacterium]